MCQLLNVREIDPPTKPRQFDTNCGKILCVSDPFPENLIVQLSNHKTN